MSALRYGISSRAAAAYGTSLLIDYKVITTDDQSQIISKSKVERAVNKCLEEHGPLDLDDDEEVTCIFFDGRTDKTRVAKMDKNGKRYTSFIKEEHVTMCTEPGGKYLGHFTPKGKTAKAVAEEIYKFLVENGLAGTLLYIGGDSTVVNTGYKGGTMYFLEELLGRRLT